MSVNDTYRLYQDEQKISNNVYPDFYIRYYEFINDSQIILNDDTMDCFRCFIKMNCEKTKLVYGRLDYIYNKFPICASYYELFYCTHIENDSFLELVNYWHCTPGWKNIKIKVGHDVDILSAFTTKKYNNKSNKYDIERIRFILITAKARI